ncbi:MAG: 3-hydroxyacyl-CoA dehydrogenase, partial [Candidatus Latescibacteria bacterium]|nr:3-hydroxyacyl-CoA dehydrogenase [Candidatus Latescibacterota bacterium]
MTRVGVVGCGVMGRGVAQSLVQSGLDAVVVDINRDILDKGRNEIYQG